MHAVIEGVPVWFGIYYGISTRHLSNWKQYSNKYTEFCAYFLVRVLQLQSSKQA
jgi:hypothetical protein